MLSLQLAIDEGQGFMTWQEVEDFFASEPNDRVFMIDRNTGQVFLGSGDHGRIPVANQANPKGNVVAQIYRRRRGGHWERRGRFDLSDPNQCCFCERGH